MDASITAIIGIACTIAGAVIGYSGFLRTAKRESADNGKHDGTVLSELAHCNAGIDDIKAELKDMRRTNSEILCRLTAVEASAKQAHKRIDRIEGLEDSRGKE